VIAFVLEVLLSSYRLYHLVCIRPTYLSAKPKLAKEFKEKFVEPIHPL
jgi:hypothetical protein